MSDTETNTLSSQIRYNSMEEEEETKSSSLSSLIDQRQKQGDNHKLSV